jgi:hypothetical protein
MLPGNAGSSPRKSPEARPNQVDAGAIKVDPDRIADTPGY